MTLTPSTVLKSDICAWFDVRGNALAISAGLEHLGFLTPAEIGLRVIHENIELFPISPRRIMLKSSIANEKFLTQKLAGVFNQPNVNCVNVSDMHQGFQLLGDHSFEILRQMSSIDLCQLLPGHFAATEIFELAGIVSCRSENLYELLVHRSFAEYVWRRMIRCGATESS